MITYIIIGITLMVSVAAFRSTPLMSALVHAPYRAWHHREYYRLLTSGFLHANWIHLLINMFVLYQFGLIVERYFAVTFGGAGRSAFIILYLGGIIFSDLPTLIRQRNNPSYACLGASGAVSSVLFAYILFEPWSTLLIWGVLPLPGIAAAVLYLVYSGYMARKQLDNVNHDAHFYGAVYGLLVPILFEPKLAEYFVNSLFQFNFL